jgi:hypothetical protein
MYQDTEELSNRLKEDALKDFTPRIHTKRFAEAVNTLGFLQSVYATRGDMKGVTIPYKLAQDLCTLGIGGFEAASGANFEHEAEARKSLVDKIFYRFTNALQKWTRDQIVEGSGEELWYGCYQVPDWFIAQVRENREHEMRVDNRLRK